MKQSGQKSSVSPERVNPAVDQSPLGKDGREDQPYDEVSDLDSPGPGGEPRPLDGDEDEDLEEGLDEQPRTGDIPEPMDKRERA